jgi:hypothetical protein
MLLTDVYYEAGRIEAEALRRPSWARPHGPAQAGMGRRGPRRVLGQALINLGQIIAADPPPLRRMAGQAQQ